MTERFEFIDAEYAVYKESDDIYVPSIVKMCRWMEVSRSRFYEWRHAPKSATAKRRGELALVITMSFDDSNETYGYRRVHADLVAWGVPCGPELVRSVMRELGLEPCQPKPWRFSLTEGDGQEHDIPDHVNRDFTAAAPGEKMVGDITYIPTWQGWLYLATVIDCHTKELVGWAMDDNYKTPLIQKAIEMAARNHQLAGKAIFHSDRGSNYTSHEFAKTLRKLDLRQSVGRTGICYDNALAESFNAALKNELVTGPTIRPEIMPAGTSRGTLSSGTIQNVGTPHSSTGPRNRSATIIWSASSQRKLTTNTLSGMFGADHIAPSKTDAERLLVISPELADALSAIITRIRRADGPVPLAAAYDTHERTWNPPMPLLFQRPAA